MAQSISIAELREKLIGLSSNGTPITELEKLTDHQSLRGADYFTFARDTIPNPRTGQDHKNLNVKYSVLSAAFIKKFKTDDVTTWSTWTFGDAITSTIRCNTSKLAAWNASNPAANVNNHAVITIKYYRDNLSKMVRDFSAMYYDCKGGTFKYASRKYDVITTTKPAETLNGYSFSPAKWNAIQNRTSGDKFARGNYLMLLGVGSCEANNYTKFGRCDAGACVGSTSNLEETAAKGTFNSRIDLENFPNHKHKFKADVVSFYMTFRIRGTVVPLAGDASSMVTKSQYKYGNKGNIAKACHAMTATLMPMKMTGEGSLSSKEWEGNLRVANLVCEPNRGNPLPNTNDYSSHNNIPPVIFFFQNERRS